MGPRSPRALLLSFLRYGSRDASKDRIESPFATEFVAEHLQLSERMSEEINPNWLAHLSDRFERAQPILFTGAGFSAAANNVSGRPLPTYSDLKRVLWDISFPGSPYNPAASLQDLYENALSSSPRRLTELLIAELSVDVNSIPSWYQRVLGMPWRRAYTLNVDNLALGVSQRYELPRKILQISGGSSSQSPITDDPSRLSVVHLNGIIEEIPEGVTFSTTQYADRLATPDVAYLQFRSDFLSSSVVFVGTRLDEPPLWQHIALRRGRGGREIGELRQRSYLVTPELDRARQGLLSRFNVVWIPMTAQEFTEKVLEKLGSARQKGLDLLVTRSGSVGGEVRRIPEVSEISGDLSTSSEFLLGREPQWGDLKAGLAVDRVVDGHLWNDVSAILRTSNTEPRSPILVSGTAGSGKSTSLMRLSLRLVGEGHRVGWLDRATDLSPREIREDMRADGSPDVLAIDDADTFASSLGPLVRDLTSSPLRPLVLVALRSGKVDRVIDAGLMVDMDIREFAMPHLEDSDIGGIISVLERENLLGLLTGLPRAAQEAAFREQAGRQLLVAMYKATFGFEFEDKACQELKDLDADGRSVYAVVCVATAFRFGLGRDEILLATGDPSNARLNVINRLITLGILTMREDGTVWARHRVIAEIIRDELLKTGELRRPVAGLALLGATKVSASMRRSARPWRLLRTMTNHGFLYRIGDLDFARSVYGELEAVLSWDYHFWLQRGSLEVQEGDLARAELYLATSRGIAAGDPLVETEWAYLLFRKAIYERSVDAPTLVSEATSILEEVIRKRGDHHAYHVLGSQGLAWARRHIGQPDAKGRYLTRLATIVEEGCRKHPTDQALGELRDEIRREYLRIAVSE